MPPEAVEGVEGVEKFFLGGASAGKEMDIVEDEYVDMAVGFAELLHGAIADGADHMFGKGFRFDVENVAAAVFEHMGGGHQEMGLADALRSVEVDRIEAAQLLFFELLKEGDRHRIFGSDKVLKGGLGIERVEAEGKGSGLLFFFRFGRGWGRIVGDAEVDFDEAVVVIEEGFAQVGADMLFKPERMDRVGGFYIEIAGVEVEHFEGAEPFVNGLGPQLRFLHF